MSTVDESMAQWSNAYAEGIKQEFIAGSSGVVFLYTVCSVVALIIVIQFIFNWFHRNIK